MERDHFFGVVLDEHGTVAELVEFFRVTFGGLVADIALRVKQLGGALDARANFPDLVHLAFPTGTELGEDLVFFGDRPPGF